MFSDRLNAVRLKKQINKLKNFRSSGFEMIPTTKTHINPPFWKFLKSQTKFFGEVANFTFSKIFSSISSLWNGRLLWKQNSKLSHNELLRSNVIFTKITGHFSFLKFDPSKSPILKIFKRKKQNFVEKLVTSNFRKYPHLFPLYKMDVCLEQQIPN